VVHCRSSDSKAGARGITATYAFRSPSQDHRSGVEGSEHGRYHRRNQGEWFYLKEDEPLDRANPEFFILHDGKVQSSTKPDVTGEYVITDDGAVLTFARRGGSRRTIALRATGAVFDETTPTLQADATYEMEEFDEPMNLYGAFIRRGADYFSTDDVSHWAR
jgi:hypothetical protein